MTSLADPEDLYKKCELLKREDVQSLREWVDKQAHLPKISELQAILFLHSCYYSNERAKTTVETFFTARTHSADMFAQLNPLESPLKNYTDVCVFAVLPQTTPEGYRVIYCKVLDSEPARYIQTMQLKVFDMMCQLCLHKEGTEEGQIIIMDMDGIVLGHVGRLSLLTTKIYLHYLQEGMPVRLKGFHVINVVSFVDKVMAFMRPFMKKDLLEIFHLHTTHLETLFKFVPQQCLPKELGGSAGTYAELLEKQLKDLKENADFFTELQKQVVDETKRTEKTDYKENMFGLEGTFKKLTID